MTEATKLHSEQVLERVDAFFDELFDVIDRWVPELRAELELFGDKASLSGSQLAALVAPGAQRVLNNSQLPLYGAGFCGAPELVSTGSPLAWWQGVDRTQLASSTFAPGQSSIDLYRLEWYRVPAETGHGHVAGPFVDYLCSNEITLTAAQPIYVGGAFIGVVCVDVLVAALETVLLPHLATLGDAVLINANGRVLLSTDEMLQTGDRLPGGPPEADVAVHSPRVVSRSLRHPFAVVN